MRYLKFFGLSVVCAFYLIWGGIILLFKKNDIGPIYKGLRFFLRHPSYQKTIRILRADPDFDQMIRTRYRAGEQTDWGYLRSLPEGTLGRSYFEFMGDQAITPIDRLPENKVQIDPDTDYMRARIRFIHDIHHVICGYPATPIGEVQISAFYVAQIESPLNMMVMAVGIIKSTLFAPEKIKDVIAAIADGWHLGQKSLPVFGVKFEEMWEEPLSAIRKRLGIVQDHAQPIATQKVAV
jgi:ubiquinone biosynthesis protein COQ4